MFAVFSIIRYRTEQIPIREMTYLFIVIIVSVINALSSKSVSFMETVFSNLVIVASIAVLEKNWFVRRMFVKEIKYEKIELIKPANYDLLLEDLKERTGLDIQNVIVERINFLNDAARLRVFYHESIGSKIKKGGFAILIPFLLTPLLAKADDTVGLPQTTDGAERSASVGDETKADDSEGYDSAGDVTQTDDVKEKEKKSGLKTRFRISFESDDNVFRLNDVHKTRLTALDSRNVANGRFTDMESRTDTIVSPGIRLLYRLGNPLVGRKTTIGFDLDYNAYLSNGEASYPEGALRLAFRLSENGLLKAGSEFVVQRFRKNYLSDMKDLNLNGNISLNERFYSPGVYDEFESFIAYRHRLSALDKAADGFQMPGSTLQLAVGGVYRVHNDPLTNRDRRVTFHEVVLDLDIVRKFGLELRYRLDSISCPDKAETVMLDETTNGFDTDINWDSAKKEYAPWLTLVNRSRVTRTVELKTSFAITRNWKSALEYLQEESDFSSSNPLDVDHFENGKTRERLGIGVGWRITKRWSAGAEYTSVRGIDSEDRGTTEVEYQQTSIGLSLRYRFL